MKVEGSHRSSLMLLWNSFAADFAFHFFSGSIYQYREERKTGKIGKERGHLFEQRNGHTTGGYKLRSVLASSARCSAFGTFCSASTLRKTSCSRNALGAISLQRSELLKSMVRTVLIIVVVECFGSCFPSSWFKVFGKR